MASTIILLVHNISHRSPWLYIGLSYLCMIRHSVRRIMNFLPSADAKVGVSSWKNLNRRPNMLEEDMLSCLLHKSSHNTSFSNRLIGVVQIIWTSILFKIYTDLQDSHSVSPCSDATFYICVLSVKATINQPQKVGMTLAARTYLADC